MGQVRHAQLLDRSVVGYLPRAGALAAFGAIIGAAFWWLGTSWWQLLVAVGLAALSAQIGFLGHDAGHQQVFRSRRWNDAVGMILSNAGIGLSYGWWVGKHRRHHQHPNDTERDPDVQRGVLAWTPEQARRQSGVLRTVVAYQAQLFFPLLLLEAVSLRVSSVRSLMTRPRHGTRECVLLSAHVVVYLGLLFWWLSPLQALAFVAVHQALLGLYLGVTFAPNHKGMHMAEPGEQLDYLRRQVLTSRNVRGGRAMAVISGSLNLQIEHHLFPSMPSHNLRRVRPLVRDFCAAHGVPYCEVSVLSSYARILGYLRDLRPAPMAAP